MNQGKDVYVTYIGAQGIAIVWIACALGPLFMWAYDGMIKIQVISFFLTTTLYLLSLRDGINAYKNKSKSDVIAFILVPSVILLSSVLLCLFVI